ncbi:MAG: prepilin peptidase [Ligilactobacillus agilis]|nr:prepilin peptidase [Ligilactobacillus agilis]
MLIFRIICFGWGSCWASFVITMVQRCLTQPSPLTPLRSVCDHCQKQLTWWQLIPLVGFILQGGRCHFCQQKISPYSTICEFIYGLVWFILSPLTLTHWLALLVLTICLLVISTTDYLKQWIYPVWLVGLISLVWLQQKWQWQSIFAAIAILSGLLILNLLIQDGIGIGDLEFIFIVTSCTNLKFALTTILIASCAGILSCLLMHLKRLAFVPALSLGVIITLLISS